MQDAVTTLIKNAPARVRGFDKTSPIRPGALSLHPFLQAQKGVWKEGKLGVEPIQALQKLLGDFVVANPEYSSSLEAMEHDALVSLLQVIEGGNEAQIEIMADFFSVIGQNSGKLFKITTAILLHQAKAGRSTWGNAGNFYTINLSLYPCLLRHFAVDEDFYNISCQPDFLNKERAMMIIEGHHENLFHFLIQAEIDDCTIWDHSLAQSRIDHTSDSINEPNVTLLAAIFGKEKIFQHLLFNHGLKPSLGKAMKEKVGVMAEEEAITRAMLEHNQQALASMYNSFLEGDRLKRKYMQAGTGRGTGPLAQAGGGDTEEQQGEGEEGKGKTGGAWGGRGKRKGKEKDKGQGKIL